MACQSLRNGESDLALARGVSLVLAPEHLIGIDPTENESKKGYKNFAVISSEIKKIDWLYLSASGHKRLKIKINKKKNEFQWLIP